VALSFIFLIVLIPATIVLGAGLIKLSCWLINTMEGGHQEATYQENHELASEPNNQTAANDPNPFAAPQTTSQLKTLNSTQGVRTPSFAKSLGIVSIAVFGLIAVAAVYFLLIGNNSSGPQLTFLVTILAGFLIPNAILIGLLYAFLPTKITKAIIVSLITTLGMFGVWSALGMLIYLTMGR
jgi:hypothetical protein